MLKRIPAVFMYIMAMLAGVNVRGQAPPDAAFWLKQIKGLNAERQRYDYKILLVRHRSNQILDSVSGRMYKSGKFYLDSNSQLINMRDAAYTLQINHRSRTAYLKSLQAIASFKNDPIGGTSTALGTLQTESSPLPNDITVNSDDQGNKSFTLHFVRAEMESLEITLDAANNLRRFVLKSSPIRSSNGLIQRVLMSENFSSEFDDTRLKTSRFIILNGSGLRLKGKYAGYKAERII